MSNSPLQKLMPVLLGTVAGSLLLASLALPLWRMQMESPQYQGPEALRVAVYPNALRGDLHEIAVLNQYIGVRVPQTLPQLRWLPAVLAAGALLGLGAVVLRPAPRRRALVALLAALTLALGTAAGMAQWQMYRIGHQRDPHSALRGVKDFTPPLLGRVKIENFTVQAGLGPAAWLIGAALGIYLLAAVRAGHDCPVCAMIERRRQAPEAKQPAEVLV